MRPEELFAKEDYEAMLKMDPHPYAEEYAAPRVLQDLYVRIVHRPFRPDPDRMIYIVNLDQKFENLYNDDLYWRAEPVKFCHGTPTYGQILEAVQRLLDFRFDRTENKTAVLNIPWDPKQPDFDS